MFFIGNNDVYALKCKQGDKGCTDLAEVKDSINKEINSSFIFMSLLSITYYTQHFFFICWMISFPRFTGSFSRLEMSKKPSP